MLQPSGGLAMVRGEGATICARCLKTKTIGGTGTKEARQAQTTTQTKTKTQLAIGTHAHTQKGTCHRCQPQAEEMKPVRYSHSLQCTPACGHCRLTSQNIQGYNLKFRGCPQRWGGLLRAH